MEVFTIGFTKRSAQNFFQTLKSSGIKRLVDVRLNNVSQLAGFSKRDDLAYFLHELCGSSYEHEPLLAPTQEMLDSFKRDRKWSWAEYETAFISLMAQRSIETRLDKKSFETPTVLLCSERAPERCHRRLALEYLKRKWGDLEIRHL